MVIKRLVLETSRERATKMENTKSTHRPRETHVVHVVIEIKQGLGEVAAVVEQGKLFRRGKEKKVFWRHVSYHSGSVLLAASHADRSRRVGIYGATAVLAVGRALLSVPFYRSTQRKHFYSRGVPKENSTLRHWSCRQKKGDCGVIHIQHFLSHLVQHEPLAYSPGGVLSILGGGSAVGLLLSWRATWGP